MSAPIVYNYPWGNIPTELYPRIIREYLDWGINHLVFSDPLIKKCLEEPEHLEVMRQLCRKLGVHFVAMHSPFGPKLDLNVPEPENRQQLLKDHARALEIAAEFGCKTYTMHVGAYHYIRHHMSKDTLRPLAIQALEQLVPIAEKLGVVIAVENSFEPTNSAEEVLKVIQPFLGNKAIGVCYDTGHANIQAPAPWKKLENYPENHLKGNWWEGFQTEADALAKLQPHVVTCHIHDNTGYADLHAMPFDGTIDWQQLMPQLRNCPRMLEYQTEICFIDGSNWAGKLLAPAGGYSIRKQVETFRKLGFN